MWDLFPNWQHLPPLPIFGENYHIFPFFLENVPRYHVLHNHFLKIKFFINQETSLCKVFLAERPEIKIKIYLVVGITISSSIEPIKEKLDCSFQKVFAKLFHVVNADAGASIYISQLETLIPPRLTLLLHPSLERGTFLWTSLLYPRCHAMNLMDLKHWIIVSI